MSKEIVDIVDKNDLVIGSASKKECHKNGLLHRMGSVFVFNSSGQVLLQRRAEHLREGGYYDFSAAGHVTVGESYKEATRRELMEELGVSSDNELELVVGKILSYSNGVSHLYRLFVIEHNGRFKINPKEVKEVAFYDIETVEKMVRDNHFLLREGFKSGFNAYLKYLRQNEQERLSYI